MDLTISLDEAQATQLQRQAATRQLSPEQLARDLLGNALVRIAEEEQWVVSNRRRLELIRKGRTAGLTAGEAEELERLQSAADQRLEPMDRQLLRAAEDFRHLADQLPDAPTP